MCLYNNGFQILRETLDRQRSREWLFVLMGVVQHTASELAIIIESKAPVIGVVLPTRVVVPHRRRHRTRLAATLNARIDDVGLAGLGVER